MKKETFISTLTDLVRNCLNNTIGTNLNTHIRIEPTSGRITLVGTEEMLTEIANSEEAIEEAAGVEGDSSEAASDYQAKQNPDFYTVSEPITKRNGKVEPDKKAIEDIATLYFA